MTFIAVWQIRYTTALRFILFKLRVITLGEFLDQLKIGESLAEAFEISIDDNKITDEKLGDERLSPRLGPTFIVLSIIFAILLLFVLLLILLRQRVKLGEKCKKWVQLLSAKLFYNAIIRYIIMNALKLAVASLVALKATDRTAIEVTTSSLIISMIGLAAIGFFILLSRCHDHLADAPVINKIGTLYQGKEVDRKAHSVEYFPLAFFTRRIVFAIATVYLHDSPKLQMAVHHVLTLATIVHLAYDKRTQVSQGFRLVEIGSEVLMHATCILLSQFGDHPD